jgi:3'-5' exoribonuclease
VTDVAKIYVGDIRPNQEVASAFAVAEKQLRQAKNGKPFLTLKLVDKSGQIAGRMWDRAEEWAASISSRSVVFVRGRSEVFRDEMQLQIHDVSPLSADEIDRTDFLPTSPKNVEDLFQKLRALTTSISKGPLRKLTKQILSDAPLVERFKTAPAAKSVHHAYLGGLLEHTVAVAEQVSHITTFYPDLNRDVLLVGAILHDIGKVDEFIYDLTIDYSDAGRLLGHLVLGVQILDAKIRSLRGFPREEAILLSHLILSHHGEVEMGAVRLPMTREALVLHFADDLDAKMNSVARIISDSSHGDERWTPYQPLFERFFFRGFPLAAEDLVAPGIGTDTVRGVQLDVWSKITGAMDDE